MYNKDLCESLGINAYRSLKEKWSGQKAAEGLVCLIEHLNEKNVEVMTEGPGSVADPIMQWKMYKSLDTRRKIRL